MTKHILSTMTSTVGYGVFNMIGDVPILRRKIRIHGGTGIASNKSGIGEVSRDLEGKPLWTPQGVVTSVSDADYDILKANPVFQKHLEAGYLKLISGDITGNSRQMEKATADMKRDGFQPLDKHTLKSRVKVTLGHGNDEDHRL